MKIGTIFGIDIRINMFLIVVVILASFTGYLQSLATLFLIIFIHDFCHTIAARAYNLRVREIELMPFGGVARIESIFEINPGVEIFIAAAGPVSNLIMAMVIVFINTYHTVSSYNSSQFIEMNLMLAGFNLLPALPLDGGRMLRAILTKAIGFKKGTAVAANMGKALAVFLLGWGIYGLIIDVFNPTAFLISTFLLYSALKEQRMATYIFLKDITYKKDTLIKEGSMPVRQLVVRYSVSINDIINKFVPNRYHMIAVLDDQWKIIGYLSETEVVDGLIEHGPYWKIGNLL